MRSLQFTIYNMTQGERSRKVVEKGNVREERYYFGGYEVYRKYVSGSLDKERHSLHVDDDKSKVAIVETLTRENGQDLQNPEITIRYQYSNHLGSACLELDAEAQIISYEEYHPFGTTSYRAGRSEAEVSLKRYKYCGKERDEESGLYYYGMRYYADWLCRFVSVDPLQFKYPELTPFQYASNAPITFIDLDGAEKAPAPSDQQKTGGTKDYLNPQPSPIPDNSEIDEKQDKKNDKENLPLYVQNNGTGNVIIMIAEEGCDYVSSQPIVSGWDVIVVKKASDAMEWINNNYANKNKSVKNLIFSSHSLGEKEKELQVQVTDNYKGIGESDLYLYDNVYNKEVLEQINSIKSIEKSLSNDAKILVTACYLAETKIVEYAAKYLNGNYLFIANYDASIIGSNDLNNNGVVDKGETAYQWYDRALSDRNDLKSKGFVLYYKNKDNSITKILLDDYTGRKSSIIVNSTGGFSIEKKL